MADDRMTAALERIAEEDPELGARLVVMSLPAAASQVKGPLEYDLDIEGVGTWRVFVGRGSARVAREANGREPDFRIQTDPRTLTEMAAGRGTFGALLGGKLKVSGKRRLAARLRAMSAASAEAKDVVAAGGELDLDALHHALPYLIDPEWTRGHSFAVRYEITGEGGGTWYVVVRDGQPLSVSREEPEGGVVGTARLSHDTYVRLATRELSPDVAMQRQLTTIDGQVYPITLLGRWIDRAQGADEEELAREGAQRRVQEERSGVFAINGAGPGDLLDYRQLYALWERQNWRASELDFTVDKQHWLTTPAEAQESTIWSLGSFYVGEERVTADLAPFLLAAPTGEIELFLATQLVDEARHAAFFDRFGAEVMALSADDLRGRMREVSERLMKPWSEVFDDGLRDVANRIKAKPDDLDLFVEGIATYHMVVEGFLAVTGQTTIRDYMLEHDLYPGFCEGFGLVERDEHRHVAFGVRFLRDVIEEDPRHRATVERVVLELAPRAAHVFCPPYVDDPSSFVTYGYTSAQVYGHAYRVLARRMRMLGIELPPAEEFMPGPIDGG